MPTDFSFDERVAQRYNAQRAHPPEVSASLGAAIADLAGQGAPVLEIGVGTGRIAQPVAAAGCHVTGLDLSPQMLGEAGAQIALVQGDMHTLPFLPDHFAAVTAVHVLHLARDWQAVMREIVRVLQPGGAFIQGDDWVAPDSVIGAMRNELRRYVMEIAAEMRPPAAGISREELLADLGGSDFREVTAAKWQVESSANDWLAVVEQRLDPESWILPPPLFDNVYTHLRAFAAETWPDLDAPQPVRREFRLKVARGDW